MTQRISDGREIPQPEGVIGEQRAREMNSTDRSPRYRALEEIAKRREDEIGPNASAAHDEAVKAFDYAYKDVTDNPQLLREVLSERRQVIEQAAKKGETVDWHTVLPEIGEKVRQRAGLPTSREREHHEWLEEARRARALRVR
jgi:hypothetical protein